MKTIDRTVEDAIRSTNQATAAAFGRGLRIVSGAPVAGRSLHAFSGNDARKKIQCKKNESLTTLQGHGTAYGKPNIVEGRESSLLWPSPNGNNRRRKVPGTLMVQ